MANVKISQISGTTTDVSAAGYMLETENPSGISEKMPIAVLGEYIRDVIGAALANGSNIAISVNDATDTITIGVTGFATVATSGQYADLLGKPALFDGQYASLTGKPTLFSGAYADLTGKPTLFSGSYTDLTNKPTLFSGSYTDLTNKPTLGSAAALDAGVVAGNVPVLQTGGVLATARMPGHTGDVTSSDGSVALTIAAKAVTVGKMADLAANSVLGNNTGATGAVAAISFSALKTALNYQFTDFSGTIAASQHPAHTGDVTNTSGSLAMTIAAGAVSYTKIAGAAIGTAAQIRANTASELLDTNGTWSALAPVTLAYSATYTPDFSTFLTGLLTLTGNITIANPTNAKPGQAGEIVLTQDATGSRTVTFGTNWKFVGGTPSASTAANAVDIVSYRVITASLIYATYGKGVA